MWRCGQLHRRGRLVANDALCYRTRGDLIDIRPPRRASWKPLRIWLTEAKPHPIGYVVEHPTTITFGGTADDEEEPADLLPPPKPSAVVAPAVADSIPANSVAAAAAAGMGAGSKSDWTSGWTSPSDAKSAADGRAERNGAAAYSVRVVQTKSAAGAAGVSGAQAGGGSGGDGGGGMMTPSCRASDPGFQKVQAHLRAVAARSADVQTYLEAVEWEKASHRIGYRPNRNGGPRIGSAGNGLDQVLYHNYGHSGSGFTVLGLCGLH